MTPPPDRFTVTPDPPVKGESYTVAYQFPDDVSSITIEVSYEPDGGSSSHSLTRDNQPLTFTAPSTGANSVTITDESGGSSPYNEDLQNPETAS